MEAPDDRDTVHGPAPSGTRGRGPERSTSQSCWDCQAHPGACLDRCHRWRGTVDSHVRARIAGPSLASEGLEVARIGPTVLPRLIGGIGEAPLRLGPVVASDRQR